MGGPEIPRGQPDDLITARRRYDGISARNIAGANYGPAPEQARGRIRVEITQPSTLPHQRHATARQPMRRRIDRDRGTITALTVGRRCAAASIASGVPSPRQCASRSAPTLTGPSRAGTGRPAGAEGEPRQRSGPPQGGGPRSGANRRHLSASMQPVTMDLQSSYKPVTQIDTCITGW